MKNKMILWVVIISMAALSMSCRRYTKKSTISESEVEALTKTEWVNLFSDTVNKNLVLYFNILGDDANLSVSDVLLHKHMGVVNIPDEIIKAVPDMYDMYTDGNIVIGDREVRRISGPTWFTAPKAKFTFNMYKSATFQVATANAVTRDAIIFWQVVMIITFIVCVILAILLISEGINSTEIFIIMGVAVGICALVLLGCIWYYLCTIISLLATLGLVVLMWYAIRYMQLQKKEIDSIDHA